MGGLQYAGYIIPFLLLINILELYISKRKNMEVYRLSDTLVNVCCGILERLFDLFFVVLLYFLFDFIYTNISPIHIPSNILTWVVALFVVDFLAYWHHRLSHEVNFMWAAHIVHHQSEELNITTVFRVSAFAVINRTFFWIWLPLIGFSPALSTSVILCVGLFQFVTHTRLVGKLGVLEYLFVTPSHHRVHHARNDKYIDKNYGHVFIIWDKMLGTFEPETEEAEFGIISGFESSNPYWAYFYYWANLFKRAKQTKKWSDKVKVFLMPPAWSPDDVPLSEPKYELTEDGKRKKYTLDMPFRLQMYTFINVFMNLFIFIALLINNKEWLEAGQYLPIIQLTSIIIVSILAFGPIMERKNWGLKLDYFRLAFLAINIPIFFWSSSYPVLFISLGLLYVAIMAFWIIRMRDYFGATPPDIHNEVAFSS